MSSRVGIDIRMSEWSGIGRYIRGFVSELPAASSLEYHLIGQVQPSSWQPKMNFTQMRVPPYGFREQVSLPFLSNHCDCLHAPNFNAPLLWPKKLVVTFHDLILYHHPDHLKSPAARLYIKTLQPLIAQRADAIVAVSEFTKQDVVKTFRVDPEKVHVIYHGMNHELLDAAAPSENTQAKEKRKPYFLCVGLLKEHKNVGVLLEAFTQLRSKMKSAEIELRLVGKPDLKQPIVRRWFETIQSDPGILHADHVNDRELKALYQDALALVFPSWFEGFGFPVLEAMALGTPVIAARASSVPEVLGEDSGLLFDPHSPKELQAQMATIMGDANVRMSLIAKGKERSRHFNWKTCVNQLEKVYESVLGRN